MSSRKASPEQPTCSDELSRTTNGNGSESKSYGCMFIIQAA
jgi:hypothetical protein